LTYEYNSIKYDVIFSSHIDQSNLPDLSGLIDSDSVRAEYIFTVYLFSKDEYGQTLVNNFWQGDLKIPFG